MPASTTTTTPYHVIAGKGAPSSALVFDSPHSWRDWPEADTPCIAPEATLLTTLDAFVDELWSEAAEGHAPMLAAHFHRAYIDANRARDDIDADLLDAPWPGLLKPTGKSAAGMGLIRRYALPGIPLYADRLSVAQVQQRIEQLYDPYHAELARRIDAAAERFGFACHIDCHSMKSVGNAMNVDNGQARPDVVVSDRDGTSASPVFTRYVAAGLEALGYRVQLNTPYKGAELVRRHGRPAAGRHSIQIEINRALYMDEQRVVRHAGYAKLTANLTRFVRQLRQDLGGNVGQLLQAIAA